MNKNMLIAGIATLVLVVVIILVFLYPKEEVTEPNNDKTNLKPEIEAEILAGIDKYFAGDERIVKLISSSEKHKAKFIEMMQSEPAFTKGMIQILEEKSDFDDLVLNFASEYSSPELFSNLIEYSKIKDLDKDKYLTAGRILASGGDTALDAIFNAHYNPETKRITDVRDIDKFVHFFPHYYQLKFWIEKYKGAENDDLLSSTAKNIYSNTVVFYSPESMKDQLKLFKDLDNLSQQELILWVLAPNRIRPEWYSWFVPMFCEAVSSVNDFEAKTFFRALVEIFELARRDTFIDELENWLKNHPSDNFGFKILKTSVKQGRTSIERYRKNNSLRPNEITGEDEAENPDKNMLPLFNPKPSKVDLKTYDAIKKIYDNHSSLDDLSYSLDSTLTDYDFEVFAKLRNHYFTKPILFEIARKAKIELKETSWRFELFNNINSQLEDFEINNLTESQIYMKYFSLLSYLWNFKNPNPELMTHLFKMISKLEKNQSQITKLMHLSILDMIATLSTTSDIKSLIKNLGDESLSNTQETNLIQVLAQSIDRWYDKSKLQDFNPFNLCLESGIISDYQKILNVLYLQKHKFTEELMKLLLANYSDDEKLIITIYKKIRGNNFTTLTDQIEKFLESKNPIIVSETLKFLPYTKQRESEFERFLSYADPIVKTSAAMKILESDNDSKVLNAISILKQENSQLLWQNLWVIKNLELIKPLIYELSQTNIVEFARNIKLRSDLMADDSIFDVSVVIYKTTDDIEVQSDILKSLLTREDKAKEVLNIAATHKEFKIRKIAWDFAENNPKLITIDFLLSLLDSSFYLDVQNVMNYLTNNTKLIAENAELKARILKFLEQKKDGLEIGAVFVLMNLEKDEEVASAFCRAIAKRVLWPVSVQVWLYIQNFKNMTVAETMIDIIDGEERNSTDFASSYLSDVIDEFEGLREKIYKAYNETTSYKAVVEFLPIFTGTKDKEAIPLLIKKDYKKLKEGIFVDDVYLPIEVAQSLCMILDVRPDPGMQKKEYWSKYLK